MLRNGSKHAHVHYIYYNYRYNIKFTQNSEGLVKENTISTTNQALLCGM